MKTNWTRQIIGGLSFTSAMFIFQACYGTPQDFAPDVFIEGQVIAKTSGLPIKGIKVSVAENLQYQMTDENGKFAFYTEILEKLTLKFEDIDSEQNGMYMSKDTVLNNVSDEVILKMILEEK